MAQIQMVRDFYLWGMAVMYLFAFGSLYNQVPGLYGRNGLLPAHLVLKQDGKSLEEAFVDKPTLLWFMPGLGIDVEHAIDLLCILGILISFLCMISRVLRDTINFALLWFLYFSVYQVGQTFLWFQWDILLLEAGFLTILVAPLNLFKWKSSRHYQHDTITMWLIKWLLFRLMFASGVVKLTSQCPTWWELTALTYHYETQCISTPLAWYAHQLPVWLHKLSVVFTYVIEIALPFLFFSPIRTMRIFAGLSEVFLMLLIFLTGNYNFFNLITVVLCLSTLDDSFFKKAKESKPRRCTTIDIILQVIVKVTEVLVYGGLIYWIIKLFTLRIDTDNYSIESTTAFSSEEFSNAIKNVMPITIWIGIISLSWEIIYAIFRSLYHEKGILKKVWSVFLCVLFSSAAVYMFTISLIPHTLVDNTARENVYPIVRKWYRHTDQLQLANSYGLFRRMTGVGGRPEVIVEGSHDLATGWKEYEFLYKPGNESIAPPIVAPHQPRLDWQMWFAALGDFRHNPWFLHMIYRLLRNEPDVIALIDKNPFPVKPPRYIRAQLYHYHFTKWDQNSTSKWWKRKWVREYMPTLTLQDESFMNYLKKQGIVQKPKKKKVPTATLR